MHHIFNCFDFAIVTYCFKYIGTHRTIDKGEGTLLNFQFQRDNLYERIRKKHRKQHYEFMEKMNIQKFRIPPV